MNAFLPLLRTNYRDFVRDRTALFWTIAFPVLFIGIFGIVLGRGDDGASYEVGLVMQDSSPQASTLGEVLSQFEALDLTRGDRESEIASLADGDRRAVIVVPAGFGASISDGEPQPLQVHFDPSQQTTQQVVIPVLLRAFEVADRALTQTQPVVIADFQTLQSERLQVIDFIMPGLIAMSVMNGGVFGAIAMVSLRERRVLRRLSATPLPAWALVGADVTFRMVVVLLQTVLLVVLAVIIGGVAVKVENLPALAGVTVLGGLAFVAIGFFLGAFAKTEQGFFPVAQVITFPMLFLSGIFFPLDSMPDWIRPVVSAMPLTYLGDAMRQLMVGGAPVHSMALNLGVLAAFLVVFFGLAVRLFKYE